MKREIDTLNPPTAGRLLSLWQSKKALEDPLERVLRCNGAILAESCFFQGTRVFDDEDDVLQTMTPYEMEQLLYRLLDGAPSQMAEESQTDSASFDWNRFEQLRGR